MSAVEVSEGYPTEGRIFEPPQTNLDNEAPRYLTFLGSLIEPRTATERPWTKGGGIEVTNPCLRYVKHFLRKGRITPLLKDTHDFQPIDKIRKIVDGDPTQFGWFPQVPPPGYVAPMQPPPRGVGFGTVPSPVGSLVGKLAFPGDQINWILTGPVNVYETMPRGIVELHTLKGQPYQPQQLDGGVYVDPTIWQIQRTIFPQYPFMPVLLDDIARLLDAATEHTMLREIVDEFQTSLTQFTDFATIIVQNTHAKMREIAANGQGYVPRYTALDLVLLEQLGIARQDREIQRAAKPAADDDFKAMFKAFLQSQAEEKAAMTALFKAQTPEGQGGYPGYPGQSGYSGFSGEVVTNATPAGAEAIATAMADAVPDVVFQCPNCDHEPFDTIQGLTMHKQRWCKKELVSA